MAQSHDDAVDRGGRHLEAVGHGCWIDHEGVVAGRGEGVRETDEDPLAFVVHLRDLAVHERWRWNDVTTEDLANGLMPEAHPEDGDDAAETAHELCGDPGIARATWSR